MAFFSSPLSTSDCSRWTGLCLHSDRYRDANMKPAASQQSLDTITDKQKHHTPHNHPGFFLQVQFLPSPKKRGMAYCLPAPAASGYCQSSYPPRSQTNIGRFPNSKSRVARKNGYHDRGRFGKPNISRQDTLVIMMTVRQFQFQQPINKVITMMRQAPTSLYS